MNRSDLLKRNKEIIDFLNTPITVPSSRKGYNAFLRFPTQREAAIKFNLDKTQINRIKKAFEKTEAS